ncbi:MAG: GTPase, partial [Coprobacillaceae bacterium]
MEQKVQLSPKRIVAKEFKVDFKGYNADEVDHFLDIILKDYEEFAEELDTETTLDTEVTDEERLNAMRSNLDAFELEEDDIAIISDDGEFLGFKEQYTEALPVVAIVGRPNVGKSALVNRILGRREAVVEDVPGVTRDRVTYQAEWEGKRFSLVDTGGWEPDAKGIDASVALQAELAIELCDVVMFVVDSRVG